MTITMNKYRKAHQLLEEAEREGSGQMSERGRVITTGLGALGKTNRSMSVTREVTRVVRV